MLPTDMELVRDRTFRKHAREYARDQDKFFKDFAAAFGKLLELGVFDGEHDEGVEEGVVGASNDAMIMKLQPRSADL